VICENLSQFFTVRYRKKYDSEKSELWKIKIFAIIRYFLALIQAVLRAIQTEFIFKKLLKHANWEKKVPNNVILNLNFISTFCLLTFCQNLLRGLKMTLYQTSLARYSHIFYFDIGVWRPSWISLKKLFFTRLHYKIISKLNSTKNFTRIIVKITRIPVKKKYILF
jgi:hypothetical protein